MANLNKVFLMGNLTRDPEIRYTPSGAAVCNFGMAINRQWKTPDGESRKETCFVDCQMWGRRGEVIAEYLRKGSPIFVEGHLRFEEWERDGQRRSRLRVNVDNFEFLGGRGGDGGSGGPQGPIGNEDRGYSRDRQDRGSGEARRGRDDRGDAPRREVPPAPADRPQESDGSGSQEQGDDIPF